MAQAKRLKAAGATVYNPNLDTSRDFYGTIIHTRTFDDRLETIRAVRAAGLEVCSGGIVGMGEEVGDHIHFLHELTLLDPPPESIPINQLVPVAGTPLAGVEPPPPLEFVRMLATARILFTGDKLLTTPNPGAARDRELLEALGMRIEAARAEEPRES